MRQLILSLGARRYYGYHATRQSSLSLANSAGWMNYYSVSTSRNAVTTDKPTNSIRQFSTDSDSYFARKAKAKEIRTQEYEAKMKRREARKTRRAGRPTKVMKNKFRSWWDKRRAFDEIMDSKARREGLDWEIDVSVILERIPVVLPDLEDWEKEFDELQAYLNQFGKEYPKELFGETTEEKITPIFNNEELLAQLPEGFTPAPRETEADKTGKYDTLDRKLKTKVFLAIQADKNSKWKFPTVRVKSDETLLEAAKRAVADEGGCGAMDIYYPSNCPVAVSLSVYPEDQRPSGIFGVKTFFMRVQHDEFDVSRETLNADDFGWFDRDEIVERFDDSKFFQYVL